LAARRAEARLDIAKERLVELQAGPRRELVLQALAEVEEAQEAVKLADEEVLRLKQIAAKTPALVSAQETARAEGAARTARARLKKQEAALALVRAGAPAGRVQAARAEVALRQVEVEQAKAQLAAATIRAPFDGSILKLHVAVGEVVNPR